MYQNDTYRPYGVFFYCATQIRIARVLATATWLAGWLARWVSVRHTPVYQNGIIIYVKTFSTIW